MHHPAELKKTPTWLPAGCPAVTVIIPVKNEAKNLPWVFERLPLGIAEVIVVDGGSTDGTADVARSLRPDVVIVQQTRRGKGNALACGFAAATGDIIVMLDADGSAHPAEIPDFVGALLAGADFAKGTRFTAGGGSADITHLRRLGNAALSGLVNALYKTRYSDLCYGYNAFWAHCTPHFALPSPELANAQQGDGFEIETMLNIRVARSPLAVHEVASFESRRLHGVSNLNALRDGLRVLKVILGEWGPAKSARGVERRIGIASLILAQPYPDEPALRAVFPLAEEGAA